MSFIQVHESIGDRVSEMFVSSESDSNVRTSSLQSSYLSNIDSGALKYQEFTIEESDIRIVSKDAAVVNGFARIHALNRNNEIRISLRFTNVWILRGNNWENVLWQATPASK